MVRFSRERSSLLEQASLVAQNNQVFKRTRIVETKNKGLYPEGHHILRSTNKALDPMGWCLLCCTFRVLSYSKGEGICLSCMTVLGKSGAVSKSATMPIARTRIPRVETFLADDSRVPPNYGPQAAFRGVHKVWTHQKGRGGH